MSIRPLCKELQQKAVNELNEDFNRIREDLDYIKQWAKKQPHLKIRTDDQWLLSMLRGCKFSLERTKEKLDLLYTLRTIVPELFTNRDPLLPELQEMLNLGIVLPFAKTSEPGAPRIVMIRLKNTDPGTMRVEDGVKVLLMILDILLMEDDNFVIAGQHLFIDDEGITVNHMLQLTPGIVKKVHTCLLEAYALRPKGFHVINVPQFAEMTYNMLKSLLNDKILNRVKIYKNIDMDQLFKAIPISILPKEYGGNGDSIEDLTKMWKSKVEGYREWFLEDAQYCSDESKRIGKPKDCEQLFGMEGSFRKLDLD